MENEILLFGSGDSSYMENAECTMTFSNEGVEVMRISPDGVISFPHGKPADELARQVMEVLERTILDMGV